MIYFDNASTTLIKPREVANAMYNYCTTCGNAGRSGHKASMKSSQIIFNTRQKVCDFLNCENPEDVIFTYNATYALNLAIKGCITQECSVITSGYEHNSTIRPLMSLEHVNVKIVESDIYDNEGFLKEFVNIIDINTKYAVINHVSNVFGYILPIKEIDEICHLNGIKLILDISQSVGILDIDLSTFKSVVAVCMPAHKGLYSPMGLGILVLLKNDIKKTIIQGGTGSMSQMITQPEFLPDMLEAGTPNVPAIGALFFGIDYVSKVKNMKQRIFSLARYFSQELKKNMDTTVFFEDDISVQTGVISFINNRIGCEEIASLLAKEDICTRAGYHCSPLAHKSTNTNGTIRASFSSFNNFNEIDKFISVYNKL